MNPIFFNRVLVSIQGDEVLSILDVNAGVGVRYQVVGFDRHQLIIEDRRTQSLPQLAAYQQGGALEEFLAFFNAPAQLTLYQTGRAEYAFILTDPADWNPPNYTLWVAIGIGESIPAFDYDVYLAEPYLDERFALVSIYLIPGAVPLHAGADAYRQNTVELPLPESDRYS